MIPEAAGPPPPIWRLVFSASVFLFALTLVLAFVLLPDRVPIHFNAAGDPDRVVGRTEALVTFALLGAAMALLLGGVASYSSRLPSAWLNIPHKTWWEATPTRERRLRAMLETDLRLMGTATMVLLAGVMALVIQASRAEVPHLSGWSWVLIAVYVAVVLGYAGYATVVRYRPSTGRDDPDASGLS